MQPRFILVTLAILLSMLVAGSTDVVAQSAVQDLIITQTNAEDFPQVTLRFRALDTNGLPASNVQLNLFNVNENGQAVSPENLTKTEAGIWVHFVVDAGVWLLADPWKNVQAAITDFVQTTPWMKENLDHVALTVVPASGMQTLVPFTENGRDLLPALESFTPPRGTQYSAPVKAMDEIIDQMVVLPEAKNQARFIVFLSAGLETGSGTVASELSKKALEQRIPIYVIALRADQSQPLQKLAEESGGRFALYNRLTDVNPLYTQLVAYREQYDITYRSAVSQSGSQQVELIANVSAAGHISSRTSYDIEVNPPRVLIGSPAAGQVIARQAPTYTDDRAAIPPTTHTVVASVIFPDNHLRRLVQAALLVDGVVANTLTRPSPTSDLEFVWDLRDVQQDGVTDFSLEVEITDELGLVSRSPAVIAKVNVSVPPKPDTPTPVVTPVNGGGGTPTPTPVPCNVVPDPLCPVEIFVRTTDAAVFVALGIAMLSMVFSGVVWVNRDKASVQRLTQQIKSGVDRLTKRYLGPSEAKAYLVVLEGDVNIGKSLEIFGDTPIGRSRQNAELLFQQHDETSPLSRLHCTIVDEEDHFLLRDEDSANGTYLNGRKLIPLQPEELHEGDEIELARVERGGVRLLFQSARPGEQGDIADVFKVTKQTRSTATNGEAEAGDGGDRF